MSQRDVVEVECGELWCVRMQGHTQTPRWGETRGFSRPRLVPEARQSVGAPALLAAKQ